MNEFTIEFFTATTADDQSNYFHGKEQQGIQQFPLEGMMLPEGTYRVIDGLLCLILSGLPTQDIRERLRAAANHTP